MTCLGCGAPCGDGVSAVTGLTPNAEDLLAAGLAGRKFNA